MLSDKDPRTENPVPDFLKLSQFINEIITLLKIFK